MGQPTKSTVHCCKKPSYEEEKKKKNPQQLRFDLKLKVNPPSITHVAMQST